ncbi:hypothetical protein C1H46_034414 [Malus baccata]|uniref:Anaphase-promoting complex subunit 7 n=1 Tax=Malus baccata TaxID=106549 RepID=A0A540L0N3_MALBA|nr:hypothetical protein C1H46_034414 [Malus baccata]
MEVPKDQIATLMEHGLYNSAQMLGCFLVSSPAASAEINPHLKAESLVLLGDSLYREREFRRAIHTYKQALQLCKMISKTNAPATRSSLSSTRSSSPNLFNISGINENEVKFKIASSYFALGENGTALSEVLLGDSLYREREFRRAIHMYKQALQLCKMISKTNAPATRSSLSSTRSSSPNLSNISGINENEVKFKIASSYFALGENGTALSEMDNIPSKSRNLPMNLLMGKLYRFSKQNRSAVSCFKECLRFVNQIVILMFQFVILCGLELFTDLLQRFPNNLHLLLEVAKVEAIIGKNDEAILNFEKARSIDPYVVTYMDEYAMLLKTKSDFSKLNKLVHDLLIADSTRPEVFVALSVLWERKDERGSLSYVEKSIRIDERHIPGYIMKGNLLLSMKRAEAAVVAFRAAQELRPDIRSYQGLVHSYLALSKIKEALYASREAMKAMPQSAKALKLVGDVHASNPGGREKAKKFYESALRLEPGYLGAALALAELHVNEGRNGDAVSLLERYLKDWADDSLHVKLAQVFAATNMLQESLSHYQAALRINQQNEAAKKGLERLEKQMKGVDPDAPEEDDEENEVDDADGDQEETELL